MHLRPRTIVITAALAVTGVVAVAAALYLAASLSVPSLPADDRDLLSSGCLLLAVLGACLVLRAGVYFVNQVPKDEIHYLVTTPIR